ncbi:mitochondrial uncoupling protein 4 [Reticulomyxa filosa]|uniref:Mitochondrial uncoupling protein 4 n=1 Tax=Reticulomyxa filosa TaxID=46433 RepID=X6NYR5_RETFI|nr:mitochondrial uncoupling protein 4 [Reticulomyxa filosa]|eukprot:ETO30407.1 mitochondrial uncoupling protein 4 [Reticulomyxa filosa]
MSTDKAQSNVPIKMADPNTNKKPQKPSPMTTYLLGGVSACTAELVVYPLDTIKTRLQVVGKKDVGMQRDGMVRTATGIFQREGLTGFYNGFSSACYRHMIYSGCRYLSYEFLRENVFKRDADGHFPLWKSMLSALSAGFIGQYFASPFDLVKVRMQTEGLRILKG